MSPCTSITRWPSGARSSNAAAVPPWRESVLAIENRLRLTGNRTAMLPGRMEAAIQEHEELLDAIARGDAEAAERLNRERIQHIRDAVAKSISFAII